MGACIPLMFLPKAVILICCQKKEPQEEGYDQLRDADSGEEHKEMEFELGMPRLINIED